MEPTTVFNLTENPVRFTGAGNRVPGREAAVVEDTADEYYVAALTRGDLVVLSGADSPVAPAVDQPIPSPEPAPEPEVILGAAPADGTEEPESKKKQPSKAKEN